MREQLRIVQRRALVGVERDRTIQKWCDTQLTERLAASAQLGERKERHDQHIESKAQVWR